MSACFATACTVDVSVLAPDMTDAEFSPQAKTPGHFAVMIPSGAWRIEAETDGLICNTKYPTDFDTGYAQAAKEGFEQAFESVVFTTTALKPEQLKSQKLDAQIVVSQGSITAKAPEDPKLTFSLSLDVQPSSAEVAMDGVVEVMGPDGAANHRTIIASGSYSLYLTEAICFHAVPLAIDMAGGAAIKEFVLNSVNAAKLDVMALKGKKASAEPVN